MSEHVCVNKKFQVEQESSVAEKMLTVHTEVNVCLLRTLKILNYVNILCFLFFMPYLYICYELNNMAPNFFEQSCYLQPLLM